uniref:HTH CENPB-type domain-containing protein n=1 Tax=Plectus sambesii TaxID=2011161 RepID=A0A914VYG0_9BILA
MNLTQRTSIEEIPVEMVAPIQRRLKLRSYRSENMTNAIERFKAGEFSSIRKVAKECGVALETLRERIVKGDAIKTWWRHALSHDDETDLVSYLQWCARVAQPLTKREVIVRASKIFQLRAAEVPGASQANLTRILSQKWWRMFARRHPELRIGKASLINAGCATVEPTAICNYFQLLQQ